MAGRTRKVLMIALDDSDIQKIRDNEVVQVEEGRVAVARQGNKRIDMSKYDFTVGMTDRAIEELSGTDGRSMLNYGINHTGDEVEEVIVRRGRVSEDLGTDKNARQRVIESGMSPEEADRYL